MGNPILENLNKNSAQNEQGLPTSMSDPRMKDTINYVNQHGGNPKQAFYNLCKEKMLNPAVILNQFLRR